MDAGDLAYIERVGMVTIRRLAEDFVREKLAPTEPVNDGRQTPMRNAPKNEVRRGGRRSRSQAPAKVRRGVPLTDTQKAKAVVFLMAWVERRMRGDDNTIVNCRPKTE